MTKPSNAQQIPSDLIDTIAAALPGIVGDAPLIVADARLTATGLGDDSATDVVMDFVGRVLEHCVARADGSALYPSRTPAVDTALAAATLRSVARRSAADEGATAAWGLAVGLLLRGHEEAPA